MRRNALLAAAVGSLIASSAYAGFSFSTVGTPTPNGNTRVDVFVLNDGQAVGTIVPAGTTRVQAIQFVNEVVTPGTTFKFRFASGAIDLFNNRGEPNDVEGDGSLILPNNATALNLAFAPGDNTYQGVTFSPAVTNSTTANNVTSFTADYAATSGPPLATSSENGGRGARVASLVISAGGSFTASGTLSAEAGGIVPYTFSFPGGGPPPNPVPVVTVAPSAVAVDVSPVGTEGFSAVVTAVDTDLSSLVLTSGLAGTAIADNVTITGGTAGPLTVTGSGLTFNDLGTYTLTFTGTDAAGGTGTGTLTVSIVPEPATFALVGIASLGLIRRRK